MKVHFVKFFSLTFLVVCIFASCGKTDEETFDFFGAKSTIEISDYAQNNGYSEDEIIEYFKESKANLIVEDYYMKISSDSFSVDFELKKIIHLVIKTILCMTLFLRLIILTLFLVTTFSFVITEARMLALHGESLFIIRSRIARMIMTLRLYIIKRCEIHNAFIVLSAFNSCN